MLPISTVKHAAIAVAVTFGAIYLGTRLFPRAAAFALMPGAPWLTNPVSLIGPPSMQLGFGGSAGVGSSVASNRDPDAAFMA